MNAQETTGIRELTAQYLEYVSGGAVDGNDGNDALALMALANATWREYRSARSGIPSPPLWRGGRIARQAAQAQANELTACACRDPQPVATVQLTDANASCAMIVAEMEANNLKVQELAGEQGGKVAQNVAAGVAGIVIPSRTPYRRPSPAGPHLRCARSPSSSASVRPQSS